MSSPTSPYKEIGLNGGWLTRPEIRKKVDVIGGIFYDTNKKRKWGHVWYYEYTREVWTFNHQLAQSGICKLCHQPKFVVDGKPCRGRKS